jgi:glycosyltransferase involved in cell wall biosynthesis
MRVAFVHDWLVTYGGAERVLAQMLACFPQADVFTLVDFLSDADRGCLGGKTPVTSFIQRLPAAQKGYRNYLPLMPLAIEQFDLSAYDLVISSSHAVAKGVIVGPDQLHVCMCYSPIRYAWDMQHQYLQEAGLQRGIKSWLVKWVLHKLRIWDARTAHGVDQFIAISHYIARRIDKTYRRDAVVIYPPVDLTLFQVQTDKADYYFTASRHVPYKKIPLIIEAFNRMPDKRLVVMGDGPEFEKCKKLAGPNVQLLGHQPAAALQEHLQRAKAFVFAAEEDFGIAPLEAQASGTPVIAFGKGGALETIRGLSHPSPTGLFFSEQTAQAICAAVHEFELNQEKITSENCRANAERFSQERFRQAFTDLVNDQHLVFQRSKEYAEH